MAKRLEISITPFVYDTHLYLALIYILLNLNDTMSSISHIINSTLLLFHYIHRG